MPSARTTHRSAGKSKLYAVRSRSGEIKDIQTYKRAHGQDIKRVSKAETEARKRKGRYASAAQQAVIHQLADRSPL